MGVPVLIGIGQVRGRARPPQQACEPLELVLDAVRAAIADAGVDPAGLDSAGLDSVAAVHVASWAYDGLAARIAAALGAAPAHVEDTPLGGQWPTALLEAAAARIAAGETRLALIAGGEAQASVRVLARAGTDPVELGWSTDPGGPPDLAGADLHSARMHAAGLLLPTRVYPLFESALRAARGETPEDNARASAALYAAYSAVAADNPAAWNPVARSAEDIGTVGPGNRMVCEPYPLAVNAMPHVDQAAAVLVADRDHARALGVPDDRMVHVWGGAAARDSVDVLARPSFARSDALADALDRALGQAGVEPADLDVVDVYSCFPVVPKLVAAHLGRAVGPGATGGHSAFGGPLSSYALHAIVAVAARLRRTGGTGLVHGNGGYLTHEHALLLGRDAHPGGYVGDPVPRDTAGPPPPWVPAIGDEDVVVETATVEHGRDGRPVQAFLVARTAAGARCAASTAPGDTASAEALSLRRGEVVGRRVRARQDGGHVEVS